MNILVTGQCTLHWGRMEFGNIGNFYILDPFFREISRVFPDSNIRTTLQTSDEFQKSVGIKSIPMESYFDFNSTDNLKKSLEDLKNCKKPNSFKSSSYLSQVDWADLVIDLSGDIWGKNADFLGKDRFLTGINRKLIVKEMGKKSAMLVGSPGPFDPLNLEKAREGYESFDLVTNREDVSTQLLKKLNFDLSKTYSLACPSFLFDASRNCNKNVFLSENYPNLHNRKNKAIGVILCGWNFEQGPFDLWPRPDAHYKNFINLIKNILKNTNDEIFLMSHSNGFNPDSKEFELEHGRDYFIAKRFMEVIENQGIDTSRIHVIERVNDAWETKVLLGEFDLLISGRIHGAIGSLSQSVPTLIIDYGHEPKAHKLEGFAKLLEFENFVTNPLSAKDMIDKFETLYNNIDTLSKDLKKILPSIQNKARKNFDLLKEI